MRLVFEALERRMWPWYLTGSEALAAYGSPRQTMDTDVMVATTPSGLETLAEELSHALLLAEPIHTGGRWMASLIDRANMGKVDLATLGASGVGKRLGLDVGGPDPGEARVVRRRRRAPAAGLRLAPPDEP